MLISLKDKYTNKEKYEITQDEAVWYNDLIFDNSNEQIYSQNEAGLLRYKKNV